MHRLIPWVVLTCSIGWAQDVVAWPQFRGPGSRGVAVDGKPFPAEFGADKNLVWKCAIPPGHSSPCIHGNRVFLTGAGERSLETVCIARDSGRILWRKSLTVDALERAHRVNSAASPTPATDGERVFVYFGSFGLLCYDFAGDELWRRELESQKNTFGTASSPIVVGGHVILNRDTNGDSWLQAFDAKSGKTVWKTDRTGFKSGWSTPVLWKRGGETELLVNGAFRLSAYDVKTGEERWSVPGLTDEPCVTPVTADGVVFVSSYNMRTNPEVIGLPKFAALLEQYDKNANGTLSRDEVKGNKSILSRIDADGEGDHPLRGFFRFLDRDRDGEVTAKEWQKIVAWLDSFEFANALLAVKPGAGDGGKPEILWQFPRGVPECPSPLYVDGRVYMVKNGGIATCLDAKTGAVKFEGRLGARGPCYASPVYGDGKIYAASARGVVTVFKAGTELEVLARNDLKERVMATPALVDGKVYVRTAKHLFAFGRG